MYDNSHAAHAPPAASTTSSNSSSTTPSATPSTTTASASHGASSTSHSSSSPLSRFSSWMSGCFSRSPSQLTLTSKTSSSPSLFERVKAAATTSRFERDLLKKADGLIETFFNDKHFKPTKAQDFDKICQKNLIQCLESFRASTDYRKTEKTAASVLKVVHKLIVDFHMRRIRHPKRLTLLCWEWDSKHDRYKTGGDMSRWEIEVCTGVGHVKKYCAEKFSFNKNNIHIIYQGRHLTDEERFRDVCVQKGSFINMIFLREEDTLNNVNLDVAEMEHGTPQECIEKSEKWMRILLQLLDSELVGKKVATLTWDVMGALPRRSCYQHVLLDMSDKKQIFGGDVVLPKELAGLIGEFVPSTIQDIYLEKTNGDPAGVDTTVHDAATAAAAASAAAAATAASSPSTGEGDSSTPATAENNTTANESEASARDEAGEGSGSQRSSPREAPASPPSTGSRSSSLPPARAGLLPQPTSTTYSSSSS